MLGGAHLHEVIELVEELLARGVHLGVGLAHVLVQRLVVVDGRLQRRDVRRRRHRGRHLATLTPLGHVLHVLKRGKIIKIGLKNRLRQLAS